MRPWLGSLQRGASRGCGVGSAELRGGRFFSRTAEARSQRPGRVIFVFDFNSKGGGDVNAYDQGARSSLVVKNLLLVLFMYTMYTGGLLGCAVTSWICYFFYYP